MRTEIDFDSFAPQIINDVAHELMRDRTQFFHETEIEIRFGNRGSFSVNKHHGTFYDFEQDVGGGMLDMIVHLCGFERKSQAVDWLQEKGFLDGTFTPTDVKRPVARRATLKAKEIDYFKLGLKLWNESSPIPYS